jgi:predicted TIM-barrel fold metal-dependent hydrolase
VGIPDGIGIIDTLIGFPHPDVKAAYRWVTSRTRDPEELESPVEFLFKDVPDKRLKGVDDRVGVTVDEMDRWGIERGMVGVAEHGDDGDQALKRYPDRFIPSAGADPNEGSAGMAKLVRAYETWGIRAVTLFPAGAFPAVAINDPKMYPVYATCVELGIPVFCTAGVPGPRLTFTAQRVELIDDVMYDFPDLVFVTRHGCEPWTDLAVKLMLKWPGLYYSTSGFAPRYYPQPVIEYANTRGADKIIYAGYFPFGLTLERIMTEMATLDLRDHVWPKFLRANALRVLGLDG